jgi:hypothetical protein
MRSAAACLLLCSLPLVSFLDHRDRDGGGEGTGIVTLYANDDLQSSFDFRSGEAGGQLVEGEVRLDSAQIAFGLFVAGKISFGFSRDERVDVLDLSDVTVPPEARARDRTEEFPISIVHTLFRDDNGFAIVSPGGDVDPYDRADRILTMPLTQGLRHIEPIVRHVYLVRVRRNGTSTDELFKFQIIGLLPDHSVTIRWARV